MIEHDAAAAESDNFVEEACSPEGELVGETGVQRGECAGLFNCQVEIISTEINRLYRISQLQRLHQFKLQVSYLNAVIYERDHQGAARDEPRLAHCGLQLCDGLQLVLDQEQVAKTLLEGQQKVKSIGMYIQVVYILSKLELSFLKEHRRKVKHINQHQVFLEPEELIRALHPQVTHWQTHRSLYLQRLYPIHYQIMKKKIEQYQLVKQIGKGQYGQVFMGLDQFTNQTVAIKVIKRKSKEGKDLLTAQQIRLLQNEISILMSVESQNIVRFIDVKKTSQNVYIILEYCNGGTLLQHIKQKKIFSQEQALDLLRQLIQAFKALYKIKVIHRDLKPANVLVHNGMLKVADFGFSRTLGSQQMAKTSLGSPLHMAPQVMRRDSYSSKADIWSLGTIFYQLLFGKLPFIGISLQQLYKKIQSNQLRIYLDINPISFHSETLLKRMLRVDPAQRISWEDIFEFGFPKAPVPQSQRMRYKLLCQQCKKPMSYEKLGTKDLLQFPMVYALESQIKNFNLIK